MNTDELNARIREKLDEIRRYREQELPDIIGTEAVNHFRESFANEGFTDETTTKWKDVKQRTNPKRVDRAAAAIEYMKVGLAHSNNPTAV